MKIKKSIRLFTVLSVLSPMALSMMSPSALAQVANEEVKVGTEIETTVAVQDATKVVQPPFLLTETETITNEETEEVTDEVITDGDSEEEVTDEVITDGDSEEEVTDEVITDGDSEEEVTDEVITYGDSEEEVTDEVITDSETQEEVTDEVITDSGTEEEVTDEVITDGDSEEVTDQVISLVENDELNEVIDSELNDEEELKDEELDEESDRDLAADEDTELTLDDQLSSLVAIKDSLATERETLVLDAIENKKSVEELNPIIEEFNNRVLAEVTKTNDLKIVEEDAQELAAEKIAEIDALALELEGLNIDLQVDIIAKIEASEEEVIDEVEEEEVAETEEEEVEETEEEVEEVVDTNLEEENSQLHQVVCEQRDQISELTAQVEALRADATPYESMMSMMSQIMMMNQMMMMQSMQQQPQQSYGYGGNAVDFTGQMMAPMMMMQSMMMGMQVSTLSAASNPYGMANQMAMMQAMPQNQNVYNVGGDYYGRDYSMTMPGASSLMSGSAPNIPYRDFNFGNIVSGNRTTPEQLPQQTTVVRNPSQAEEKPAATETEEVNTDEMIDS